MTNQSLDPVSKAFFINESEQIDYYNQWAQNYESDSVNEGYNAPENTLEFCLKWLKPTDKIIDIGAGTGHMGFLLQQHGYKHVDAYDGSEKMLEIAKNKGVYENFFCEMLEPGKKSKIPNETYDGLITVGTFVPGHLNSDHIPELLRMLKKGGRLIIGMRKQWWTFPGEEYNWNYDLESDFKNIESTGQWRLLEKKFKANHCHGVEGAYLIYEKI